MARIQKVTRAVTSTILLFMVIGGIFCLSTSVNNTHYAFAVDDKSADNNESQVNDVNAIQDGVLKIVTLEGENTQLDAVYSGDLVSFKMLANTIIGEMQYNGEPQPWTNFSLNSNIKDDQIDNHQIKFNQAGEHLITAVYSNKFSTMSKTIKVNVLANEITQTGGDQSGTSDSTSTTGSSSGTSDSTSNGTLTTGSSSGTSDGTSTTGSSSDGTSDSTSDGTSNGQTDKQSATDNQMTDASTQTVAQKVKTAVLSQTGISITVLVVIMATLLILALILKKRKKDDSEDTTSGEGV